MEKAGHVLRVVGCSGWIATVVCADNTVLIPMRACDREKSDALVHAALKGFPAGIGFVVHENAMS